MATKRRISRSVSRPVYVLLFSLLVSCTTTLSLVSRNSTSFLVSQDNHEEATIGAFIILEISQALAETDDLDNDISDILTRIEAKCKRQILHTVCWY